MREAAVRIGQAGGSAAALAFVAFATVARAQTPVDCVANPAAALGIAIANAAPGSVLAIKGLCTQQILIASATSWGITLTNETGNPASPLMAGDGIDGEIAIDGPLQVFIDGIAIDGPAVDTGHPAIVMLQANAAATIVNVQIVNGQRAGLALRENASVRIRNSVISGNGLAGVAGAGDGIHALAGAHVELGGMNDDGSVNTADAVSISGNAGHGVFIGANSRLSMTGGSITGNLQAQVLAAGSAMVSLFGTDVVQSTTPTDPGAFAIAGFGTTTVMLAGGTTVAGGTVAGAVQVMNASDVILNAATLSNSTASHTTVSASGGSVVLLSGGNTIGNGAVNGFVVQIDHNSSLMQTLDGGLAVGLAPAPFSMTQGADTIAGAGSGQVQSTMDLGIGLIGGKPSLTWAGSIEMSQHSGFRMSGGAVLEGTLELAQSSDAFFNNANGGSGNVVSGGVTCPGTAAASHVATTPNSVFIAAGGTTSAVTFGTAPPACLPF
jgi:hypothetical protein